MCFQLTAPSPDGTAGPLHHQRRRRQGPGIPEADGERWDTETPGNAIPGYTLLVPRGAGVLEGDTELSLQGRVPRLLQGQVPHLPSKRGFVGKVGDACGERATEGSQKAFEGRAVGFETAPCLFHGSGKPEGGGTARGPGGGRPQLALSLCWSRTH